jgi:hypothetical protein
VHVRHHGAQDLRVALVELEPVTVGHVTGHDHDQTGQGVGQVRRPIGAAELEVTPRAAARPDTEGEQVAERLGLDGVERRGRQAHVVGMHQVEHCGAEQLGGIPAEHVGRGVVRIAQHPVGVDGEHRVREMVDRRRP